MNKQLALEFLKEQRELRLYNNNPDSPSDFDRWQLEQAKMYQEIIEWIEKEVE